MPKTIKKIFRNYLKLSKLQFFALILLIIINLSLISILFTNKEPKLKITDNTKFKDQANLFYYNLKLKHKQEYLSRLDKYILKRYDTLKLFPFDPNIATDKDFEKLGLTKKQILNIRLYRSRGGTFKYKDDFKRIYGIRTMQYQILKPYILLPEMPKQTKNLKSEKKQLFYFDPNTATIEQFIELGFSTKQAQYIDNARKKGWKFYSKQDFAKLSIISENMFKKLKTYIQIDRSKLIPEINSTNFYGILFVVKNKTLAAKIKNYRDKLGGFYSYQQLKEIPKINDSIITAIKDSCTINPLYIKKININIADKKLIVSHPYITWNKAQQIIDNRPFKNFEQLISLGIFSNSELQKIKPYLTL